MPRRAAEAGAGRLTAPRVSAALIVRNEERTLADCLRTLAGVADEIVVMDTGSTDATMAVARAGGATLHAMPWPDDFAAARNAALDRCGGDWILYIDADERIRPTDCAALTRLLADPGYAGHYVRLHPRRDFSPYWEMRLFRNDPAIRFAGVIHENIWPALRRFMRTNDLRVGFSALVFDHEGYEGDPAAKHGRDLPLLQRALQDDPTRIYCWYHLGRIHRERGELEPARAALRRGVGLVRERARTNVQDSLCYAQLVEIGLEHGDADVGETLAEACRLFPRQAYISWLQARLALRDGRLGEAVTLCEGLLRREDLTPERHDLGYDRRLFGAWPAGGIATARFRQGRYAESRRWFARAAVADPAELEYRVKAALCEKLMAGQPPA
jgi:glycosyltransferase involved in cell wall biosynthesis